MHRPLAQNLRQVSLAAATLAKEKAMRFSDESYDIRIQLDLHNCQFSPEALAEFESALDPLRKPVEKFPVSDLNIVITFQPRTNVYQVKMSLILSGGTLVTGEIHPVAYTAFEAAVRKMVRRLLAFEAELAAEADIAKRQEGTVQDVLPETDPDLAFIDSTAKSQDYAAFRKSLYPYEEVIRKRVGRWVQRYPDIDARIGIDLEIDDIVEEVFLNAFDRWESRPVEVPLGEWLDGMIDPSVKLLYEHPEEKENVELAKTLQEMDAEKRLWPGLF